MGDSSPVFYTNLKKSEDSITKLFPKKFSLPLSLVKFPYVETPTLDVVALFCPRIFVISHPPQSKQLEQ